MPSFFAQPNKKKLLGSSRPATPQPNKQEQKQSLILFEEVDNVFEDDRGFWSGVQTLIQSSKRPVVLTCNDTHNVPLEELDLHCMLAYDTPPEDVVTEYLCYVAAAEGHLIQPSAIRALYKSKGHDLRATITELDFWCQMTVGSKQGGLDWFPSFRANITQETGLTRTFSKDTFRTGFDLLPASCHDLETDLRFVAESLDISCDEMLDEACLSYDDFKSDPQTMGHMLRYIQARSDAESMAVASRPVLYAEAAASIVGGVPKIDRLQATKAKIKHYEERNNHVISFRCLDSLAVETSVNSLGQSRLAPSLEGSKSMLACDIAPYVRSIAAYDERLEQQRDELFSSQGKKTRTTRAARAAAEGGDKGSTRRDRWFPQNLDISAVLGTGNAWPQWPLGELLETVTHMDLVSEV